MLAVLKPRRKPMREKTKQQVGHYLDAVRADGVFVSVGEVAWCAKQGITVYAPLKAAKGGVEMPKAEAEKPDFEKGAERTQPNDDAKKAKKLPKGACRYDSAAKVYYCVAGKRLEEVAQTTLKRPNGIELPMIGPRAAGQSCQACPQQKGCRSNPKSGRVLKRYVGQEALERLAQRLAEPASKQLDKLSSRTVELG